MKTFFSTTLLFVFSFSFSFFGQEPGSGNCLSLNGSYHITMDAMAGDLAGLHGAFTVEFWMNTSVVQTASSNGALFAINTSAGNDVVRIMFGDASTSPNRVLVHDGAYAITSSSDINDGLWHHIAYTSNAGTGTLYIDGVSNGTHTTGYTFSSTDKISLGQEYDGATTSDFYQGQLDELSVFKVALSQATIRDYMCKKTTTSHPDNINWISYYKFDTGSGTSLVDSKGSNTGTFVNTPSWVTSGAPIGDESTNSYGSANSTSVTEAHADGSSFTINAFTGTPDGAHVYLVNEAPNTTTETLSGALESTRYYGTFVVGGTSPTHSVAHDYSGNTAVDGDASEAEAKLTIRSDNSGTSWTAYSNSFNLDLAGNTINKCSQTANSEYCLGFDNTILQERPGAGYALNVLSGSQRVLVSPTISLSTDYTLEAWFKGPLPNNTYCTLFRGSSLHHPILTVNNVLGVWNTSSGFVSANFNMVNLSAGWHHIAASASNGSTVFYIDGKHVGTSAFKSSDNVYSIGNLVSGGQSFGTIDEVKIWNTALTQLQVQDWMCKKITTAHPLYCNLIAYYRCDENTGSTLKDYAGVTVATIDNGAAFTLSGAPIGDESTNSYGSGNSTSVTEAHADGSGFTIDAFTGAPDGAHVYLVNEAPNTTTETLSGALESTRYYGTFVVGGSSPRHSITYDYSGNTAINGNPSEVDARLTARADNSASSWTTLSNSFDTDKTTNSIAKCSQSSYTEYCAGFDNTTFQARPGSGYALDFDGSNDYVDCGTSLAGSLDDFTLETWMYFDGGSNQWFLSFSDGTYNERIQIEVSGAGQISFGWQANGGGWQSFGGGSITASTWYHIAVTNNSSSGKQIFVNGILVASNANTLSPSELLGTNSFHIGRLHHATASHHFDGKLDEVRVWNTTLTQTEIRDWMCKKVTSAHPSYCNLESYYRFDENSGTALTDYAGGNDGTLINGPTYTLSEAPVGDESSWLGAVSTGSSINLAHENGDDLTALMTAGTATLMQMYRVDEAPNDVALPGSYTYISLLNYFGVKLFGSAGGTYSVTYAYDGFPGVDNSNDSDVRIATRSSNSTGAWAEETTHTLNTTNNTILLPSQTGTEFIFAMSGSVPLPIELTEFTATLYNAEVEIEWSTKSEVNCDFFEVERSSNGTSWEVVEEVKGAGTHFGELHYLVLDPNPFDGISFYRLKQVDFDGKFEYSNIQSVVKGADFEVSVAVFPSPASEQITVIGNELELAKIKLFDTMGKDVTSSTSVIERTSDRLVLNVSALAPRVYFLQTRSTVNHFVKQ
jgi:hypothetical protein